jgi:hypothetical protein
MTRFKRLTNQLKRRYLTHQNWILPLSLIAIITTMTIIFLWGLNSNVKAPKLKNGKGDVLYSASNSIFNSTIGTKQGEPKVTYTVGSAQAGFVLAGAALSLPVKENNQSVLFPNVYPDTNLRYTTTSNGIKEELIINKYNNTTPNTYLFDLNLQNVVPKKLANDFIEPTFRDTEDNYKFHFEKPFAVDAAGTRTNNVLLQISEDKQLPGKYSMKLIVDPKWLADPARAYPVTVDPTIIHDTTTEFASGYFDRTKDVGSGSNPQITSYYQEIPTDASTIALWRLNESSGNAIDSSSNGNTGTATGTTATTGLLNNARSFNGTSDVISAGDLSSVEGVSQLSISAWIKTDSTLTLNSGIVSKFTSSSSDLSFLVGNGSTTDLFMRIGNGGSTYGTTTSGKITPNIWHHVAMIFDGNQAGGNVSRLKIYIDGKQELLTFTGTIPATTPSNAANLLIGEYAGSSVYFKGLIDEVQISNRAFTAEEVKTFASRRPSAVYTSPVIDFGSPIVSWNSLTWSEHGVTSGDGEYVTGSAIAVGEVSTGTGNAASTASWSHTVSGANRLLAVTVTLRNFTTITNVTYGAQSLTKATDISAGSGNYPRSEIWYLIAPAIGTNTITVTAGSVDFIQAGAVTFTGVHQTVPLGPAAGNSGLAQTSTTLTTTSANNDVVLDVLGIESIGKTFTPGTGQTLLYSPTSDANWRNATSIKTSTASTTDSTWTISASTNWSQAGIAVKPASDNPPLNLVAQWNFNSTSGTTAISSGGTCGTTCNATLNNFASTSSQDSGVVTGWTADNKRWGTGALMLSSVTTADSVSLANPGSNILDPNSDNLTIETWIKTGDVSAEIFSNNSGNGTSCTSNGYRLGIDASGYPIFNLDTNGATAGCDGLINSSTKTIHDDSWHHIVVVVTRGIGANLYVDGILTGSDTSITSYTLIAPTGTIYMGGSAGGYDGIIDSTRFYSRALSPSEIVSNYQSSNLELQTRVGSTTNPNDGSWGTWESTSGEASIDNLDNPLDYATPSASLYTGALIATSAATFPLAEGTKSLKVQTGQVSPNSSIIGLWHLDETGGTGAYIKDSSGNGNHGTPTNATTSQGIVGKGKLLADSTNGKIEIGDVTALDFTGTQPFTMEAWVKMTALGEQGGIITKIAPTGVPTDNQYSFRVTTTGAIALSVHGASPAPHITQTSTSTLQVGTWTHVVGVYNGGTTTAAITLYINGELAASSGSSTGTYTGMSNGGYAVEIGKTNASNTDTIDGTLDEVIVYNIALSAEEIAESYRLGRDHTITKTLSSTDLSGKTSIPFYVAADRPGSYLSATIGESAYANYLPDASTIGLWHLGEESGTGAYIKDSSGNTNHGTPTAGSLADGKIGKGRAFDGLTAKVNVGDATNTAAITVSTWIYPTTDSDGIVTKGTSRGTATTRDWDLYGDGTDLTWMGTTATTTRWVAQAAYPTLEEWHHVVATWDGTTAANGVKLYIDGVLVAVDTATAADIADRFDVAIGGSGTFTFAGSLDETRIDSVVRTPTEIREAYEVGRRTHPITIDFNSAISHTDPLSTSSDLTFTLMATPSGTTNAGDNIYPGDKIIVRENYDGTEYIAQGTVNTVTVATGATTVSSWDGSSTFPSGGFTPNATVFKWQREYWNIDGEVQDSSLNAITNLNLHVTNGYEGRTIWLDDLRSNSGYLTTPTGSTITSAVGSRYFQYRTILSSFDETHSATLSAVTIDYVPNVAPNTPTLDSPASAATNQSLTPTLQTTATDTESDYLRYKIELCTDLAMTTNCQTFDQTLNQAGWSGQNAQTSTAYTSGTQATYTLQTPLTAATTYYWRSYAIDPAGYNGWSGTQTARSFTTSSSPSAPTTPYTEGATNPTAVTDLTPEFSAIHNDADGDAANKYEIEVNTVSDFSGTVMWDSGETSMTSTADGVRSSDISYAGSSLLLDGTTYYWRIRFTDVLGAQGAWSTTQNFTMNAVPTAPTLDSPANGATGQPTLTVLKTTGTDGNADYLRYKIELCTNLIMTLNCQTFDQTLSQTGWSGQDAETSTAYASGTQATYTIQTTLLPATTYYWRSYSIDPAGSNTWSNTQAPPYSFTTSNAPDTATDCRIQENAFDTGATIVWTDNSAVEDRYEIQRSVDGGGFSTLVTNLAANTTSYLDATAIQSHTYQYRIAPYFTAGPVYGAWCTTNVLSLQPSIFRLNGLNLNGIKLN